MDRRLAVLPKLIPLIANVAMVQISSLASRTFYLLLHSLRSTYRLPPLSLISSITLLLR